MNAIIFVAQGVQDQEFFYPYYRLKEAGLTVYVVADDKIDITGKYGIPIPVEDNIVGIIEKHNNDWYIPQNHNLVIIPGGWQAPEIMRQNKYILDYLRRANEHKTIIGTICHGPQVLISAGICYGRTMTCYKGMKDDLFNSGAKYIDKPVVVDKNIISSPHYDNNPEFMKAILETLGV